MISLLFEYVRLIYILIDFLVFLNMFSLFAANRLYIWRPALGRAYGEANAAVARVRPVGHAV